MNSYSILVVNEHLEYLLEEAADRRAQTAELPGIARIIDSGVRMLHSARALRKVAVGK